MCERNKKLLFPVLKFHKLTSPQLLFVFKKQLFRELVQKRKSPHLLYMFIYNKANSEKEQI